MSVDILGTSCDQCRSMVQYSFMSMETRRLVRTDSPGQPPRLSHSSWTMESLGKMEKAFQGLESLGKLIGVWKFVNFVVFRALGKNYQLSSQKLHFPRLNSSVKTNCCAKSKRTHFLSILTDRVHRPSATARVMPLYQMCRRVAYLRVAFLHHTAKAREKFVNFESNFCMNPACSEIVLFPCTWSMCVHVHFCILFACMCIYNKKLCVCLLYL